MEARFPRFLIAGESAISVEFGETIEPAINDSVLALDQALFEAKIEGIIETVPTYRSLMVHFDPRRWQTAGLIEIIKGLTAIGVKKNRIPRRWEIPACYEPPYGEDLAETASGLGLSTDQVISLHAGAIFRVYMYGFAPGFTFLGGLPAELGISRRPKPRPPAPSQSLMIAGGQALITSFAMPTGWYVLGRTPLSMFDLQRDPPVLLNIGDEVRFHPIDAADFARMNKNGAEF